VSAALTDRGIEHVLLERGQVGETLRTLRWDSFRLNTPGWANAVLGDQARDHYATAAEVVGLLEKRAANAPFCERVRVIRLEHCCAGWCRSRPQSRQRTSEQLILCRRNQLGALSCPRTARSSLGGTVSGNPLKPWRLWIVGSCWSGSAARF
jgi:hypothetical protein